MGAHGACGTETGWCAPQLTIYWVQTIVYTKTCRSRMHATTRITKSCWDVSRGHWRGSMHDTLETGNDSPFDHHIIRVTKTACSLNSTGRYLILCRGNTSTRRRYCQRPDASSNRKLKHNGPGFRYPCGALASGSKRASRGTAEAGRRKREHPLSPSSRLTRLLSKRC